MSNAKDLSKEYPTSPLFGYLEADDKVSFTA